MVVAHVVRDFQIGNTRIKIADNYCCQKTASEVDRILKRITERAQRQFIAAATSGRYEQQQDTKIYTKNCVCDCGSDFYSAGDKHN